MDIDFNILQNFMLARIQRDILIRSINGVSQLNIAIEIVDGINNADDVKEHIQKCLTIMNFKILSQFELNFTGVTLADVVPHPETGVKNQLLMKVTPETPAYDAVMQVDIVLNEKVLWVGSCRQNTNEKELNYHTLSSQCLQKLILEGMKDKASFTIDIANAVDYDEHKEFLCWGPTYPEFVRERILFAYSVVLVAIQGGIYKREDIVGGLNDHFSIANSLIGSIKILLEQDYTIGNTSFNYKLTEDGKIRDLYLEIRDHDFNEIIHTTPILM